MVLKDDLSSIFDKADGLVGLVRLRLIALRDAVLPPFTSRTMRSVLLKAGCLEGLRDLYLSRGRHKPVTVRALKTPRGRSLDKLAAPRRPGSPISVRRGGWLIGEVAFYSSSRGVEALWSSYCEGEKVDLGYAELAVDTLEVNAKPLSELGRSRDSRLVVDVLTPLTITARLLATSRVRSALAGARKAYRLLPTPGYLLGQAAREWAAIVVGASPPEAARIGFRAALAADPLVAEVDFNLKPVTALYGRGEGGGERLVRGVVGRIVLEPLTPEALEASWRLLEFSSYLGLGKSRSIGFGEIRVSPSHAPNDMPGRRAGES